MKMSKLKKPLSAYQPDLLFLTMIISILVQLKLNFALYWSALDRFFEIWAAILRLIGYVLFR